MDGEGHFQGKLTKENAVGIVQVAAEASVDGEIFSVVLVGPAGVGKSTLVNTLTMKQLCKESRGAAAMTPNVEVQQLRLPMRQGKGTATLRVYDTPGFTGYDEDEKTIASLRKIPSVDLLLICFDITSDGGRYTAYKHGFTLKKIVEALGKELVQDNGLIVLTKCNMLPEQFSGKPQNVIDDFQTEHKKRSKGETKFLADLEVRVAGRIEFDANGKPSDISDINGNAEWLTELFNCAAGDKSSSGLCALFYAFLGQARNDPNISERVKRKLARPSRWLLSKVLLYAAAATVGTSILVAGGALALGAVAPAAFPAAAAALTAGSVGEAAGAAAGAGAAAKAGGAAISAGAGIVTGLLSYWWEE